MSKGEYSKNWKIVVMLEIKKNGGNRIEKE